MGKLPISAVSLSVNTCFTLAKLKKSVQYRLMALRKLLLCYENISYAYSTYYVPGMMKVSNLLVHLMLLITCEVGTFLIASILVRKLRHRLLAQAS